MANSKYQSFETETISRKDIKNAEYNPRYMGEAAKKKLKKVIREHGLVSALTWNKRTGNLVGGHQRLEQLDALEKSDDYDLTVCVVDVDEAEEAKLNVILNNPSMQGEWDLERLAAMTEEFDITLQDMGFDDFDIDYMFDGDDRFSQLVNEEVAEKTKEQIQAVRDARGKSRELLAEQNNAEFYATIVFRDEEDRKEFFKKISVPAYEQYITVDQLLRILKDTNKE